MRRKKVNCFIDDKLERGEEITPSLLRAIEQSAILVVIFSKKYGSSPWCVDELAKTLDCRNRYGQVVLLVFYRVDPSAVDQHIGSFADKVPSWRSVLTTAAKYIWMGLPSQVISFQGNCPKKDFVEESNTVVDYSQGNPLALKVLGSFFLDRTNGFWENALAKIERTFRPEIHDVLRLSFDGLTDEEKSIFLDVACFLI
ncbi:unnamed protein product [Linum tenue]|uniref:TIR domain-containing protein n=1 Tax=Linum tenue TaxID=586396 RepID=A0AAV0K760_9ROSI|nr:unnamed protein product [Linum tenue]